MAEPGLTYYDDRNKVESSLLQSQFLTERLDNVGSFSQFKYTRIRTKTYSYVGLSRSTAKACVADKLRQYTRTYYYWVNERGYWRYNQVYENSYQACVADIQASKQEGELYNVEIQVNEECIIYSVGEIESTDLDRVFGTYFVGWDYDE